MRSYLPTIPALPSCNSDGMCECTGGWTGGDCSVLLNATCLAGSRRAVPRPDDHGSCWQECKCDAEGQQCRLGGPGGRECLACQGMLCLLCSTAKQQQQLHSLTAVHRHNRVRLAWMCLQSPCAPAAPLP